MPPSGSTPHSDNFDGLRLLAALTVIVSHQFLMLTAHEPMLGGRSLGTLGLAIFFVVSGFLVAASWNNDPYLVRFGMRRGLRILPGLTLFVAMASIVLATFPFNELFGYRALALTLWIDLRTALYPAFPTNPWHAFNGSLWTIPYEVDCYIALAITAAVARRHWRWVSLAALVALLLYVAFVPSDAPADLAAYFVAGTVLQTFPAARSSRVLTAMVGFGLLAWWVGSPSVGMHLVVSALVVAFGTRSWVLVRSAGHFGDFSYGLYLWAFPIQQLAVLYLGAQMPYLAMLAITLLYSFGAAWISWHLVEQPALSLKPNRKGVSRWRHFVRHEMARRSVALSLGREPVSVSISGADPDRSVRFQPVPPESGL